MGGIGICYTSTVELIEIVCVFIFKSSVGIPKKVWERPCFAVLREIK